MVPIDKVTALDSSETTSQGNRFSPTPLRMVEPRPESIFRQPKLYIVGSKSSEIKEDESDSSLPIGYSKLMNDLTREELNAKLETIEVKMDARVEAVSAKIDGFLAAQAERDKRLEERDKRLDEANAIIREDIARLGSLKLNIWGAMLTAIGIGIAVAALSAAFYQTGKADKPSTPTAPITAPLK